MRDGEALWTETIDADIREWKPGDTSLRVRITVPADFASGEYELAFAILDPRTGGPAVPLAMECPRAGLWHILGRVTVV